MQVITYIPKLTARQKSAAQVISNLRKIVPETYWVGGAVRNMVLGIDIVDIDIATAMRPNTVKKFLLTKHLPVYAMGEKFGTIGTIVSGIHIEITTFRSESNYVDHRHPNTLLFIDGPLALSKDLGRRDFTINALAYDPVQKQITDLFDGLLDLQTKIIRFVGNPHERISEDPLRMIRAVRIATQLGFTIEKQATRAIKRNVKLIHTISRERIKQELDLIMKADQFVNGLMLLQSVDLMQELLPEFERLKKVKQSNNFHAEGDVLTHTLLVLDNLPNTNYLFRYAAMFHDIGKFGTAKKIIRNSRPHISFIHHPQVGVDIFKNIAKRLAFSNQEKNYISHLILHHMDAFQIGEFKPITYAKWMANPLAKDLIELHIADILGSKVTDSKGNRVLTDAEPFYTLLKGIPNIQKELAKKLLTGNDVIRILSINSGPLVGKILQKIDDAKASGVIKNKKEAIAYVKKLDIRTG